MNRDNGHNAIMGRYEKANVLAIATHNSIMFDSIRDVFFLLEENKKLREKLGETTSGLNVLIKEV